MEELLLYYSNLLIVQYNGKPKAKATIELFTNMLFMNLIFQQIQDSFDWKTAQGAQLDIIGKWVGVSRDYLSSTHWGQTYFSYPSSASLVPTDLTDIQQHGYSDYSTFDTDTGNVLTYNDIQYVAQSLSDEDYRTVIGLKIIKNNINFTAKNIDDAIWEYFNGQVYTTWAPQEIIYNYPASMTTLIEVCNYKGVLLAPTGTEITLRTI